MKLTAHGADLIGGVKGEELTEDEIRQAWTAAGGTRPVNAGLALDYRGRLVSTEPKDQEPEGATGYAPQYNIDGHAIIAE